MKFKVGDKVRILDGSNIRNYRGGYTSNMKNYVGKVYTISEMCKHIEGRPDGYCLKDDFHLYVWDERSLELAEPETIVIYRKDQKVIALDKSTGKKAIARCNPADKFDFMTGAKLAFDRLTSADKRFNVGDIVRGKAGSGCRYGITNENMTKGKVVDVSMDGEYIDIQIIDNKYSEYNGEEFPTLESKYFELVEETKPQVKEVKRYAKPGEYIKIVSPHGSRSEEYKKGDILKVVKYSGLRPTSDATYYKDEICKYANADEYVVLEGYKPTYYTGKIMFTKGDDTFKTGHIYEIKDGTIKDPVHKVYLPLSDGLFKDIEDVKDYFTEKCKQKRRRGWSNNTLELIEVKK